MSNAPHHKPRTSNLRLVTERNVAADTKVGAAKEVLAFGERCDDCGFGSALFEMGVSRPCDACVPHLVARATKALHATGHHVAKGDAAPPGTGWYEGTLWFMACDRCSSIVAYAKKSIAPDVCVCADCQRTTVQPVALIPTIAVVECAPVTIPCAPVETSALCGCCGAWVGLKASHVEGADACGWIRGGK